MSFTDVKGRGVMIQRIDIRSFAMPLLEAGDVVTRIDARPVGSSEQLERYLRSIEPGALVVLTVQRDATTHYVMLDVPDAGE
jgi:S1-C subfamily serine protease